MNIKQVLLQSHKKFSSEFCEYWEAWMKFSAHFCPALTTTTTTTSGHMNRRGSKLEDLIHWDLLNESILIQGGTQQTFPLQQEEKKAGRGEGVD